MRLLVTVENWVMDRGMLELRFTVEDGYKEHTWTQVMNQDDLYSHWDYVWEAANRLMKKAVKEARDTANRVPAGEATE